LYSASSTSSFARAQSAFIELSVCSSRVVAPSSPGFSTVIRIGQAMKSE
jgi:hypothetical protein